MVWNRTSLLWYFCSPPGKINNTLAMKGSEGIALVRVVLWELNVTVPTQRHPLPIANTKLPSMNLSVNRNSKSWTPLFCSVGTQRDLVTSCSLPWTSLLPASVSEDGAGCTRPYQCPQHPSKPVSYQSALRCRAHFMFNPAQHSSDFMYTVMTSCRNEFCFWGISRDHAWNFHCNIPWSNQGWRKKSPTEIQRPY